MPRSGRVNTACQIQKQQDVDYGAEPILLESVRPNERLCRNNSYFDTSSWCAGAGVVEIVLLLIHRELQK